MKRKTIDKIAWFAVCLFYLGAAAVAVAVVIAVIGVVSAREPAESVRMLWIAARVAIGGGAVFMVGILTLVWSITVKPTVTKPKIVK